MEPANISLSKATDQFEAMRREIEDELRSALQYTNRSHSDLCRAVGLQPYQLSKFLHQRGLLADEKTDALRRELQLLRRQPLSGADGAIDQSSGDDDDSQINKALEEVD